MEGNQTRTFRWKKYSKLIKMSLKDVLNYSFFVSKLSLLVNINSFLNRNFVNFLLGFVN